MPTFSAIALDSLLEPGASRSVEKSVPSGKLPHSKPPNSKPPISKLERQNSKPPKERTVARPQMSPALYATPEAIPLPDSPSSFPPTSPYIINHKSRGPRLLKSFSEVDVSSRQKALNDENTSGDTNVKAASQRKSTSFSFSIPEPTQEDDVSGVHRSPAQKNNLNGIRDGPVLHQSGLHDGELGNGKVEFGSSNGGIGGNVTSKGSERETDLAKLVTVKVDRDGESEDFYDPGESASFTSNAEIEDDAGAESCQKLATPVGEFYDAWDELSTDSGVQTSVRDFEAELSEIRLSLLMEIEKRKHAEEILDRMRSHWQKLREQLAQVGLPLPTDPTAPVDGEQQNISVAEQLSCQLEVARFISDSIGRGLAKAEVEMEMEAKLEAKNFEIARLSDRLHYYEAVNREMSQRNQEAIEMARRERQRRRKRQRWIWGSIAATIAVGSAALAWSYLPPGKSQSSSSSTTDISQPSMKDE